MRNSRTNGAACKIKLVVELAPFTSNYKVQRNETQDYIALLKNRKRNVSIHSIGEGWEKGKEGDSNHSGDQKPKLCHMWLLGTGQSTPAKPVVRIR